MQSKSIQESPENQIIMLETEAKMILKRVRRRVAFIHAFPTHSLNATYWEKISDAMNWYGQIIAHVDFLRYQHVGQESEVAA